jgi:hypothetical protein
MHLRVSEVEEVEAIAEAYRRISPIYSDALEPVVALAASITWRLQRAQRVGIPAVGRDRAGDVAGDRGSDSLLTIGDADGHHARRCGKCFSLVYWTGYEGRIRVPYGSLIDEPALKPTAHMFVASKAPWYEILDDLPQHDEYPWS